MWPRLDLIKLRLAIKQTLETALNPVRPGLACPSCENVSPEP